MIATEAATIGDGRVRLDARPEHGAITLAARSGTVEPLGEIVLSAVCVPGGLGEHKWLDRRLLEALTAAVAPRIPLLVDLDGVVLEAARSNVFLVEGDRLVTPPLDGRILPGVGRAALIAEREATEAHFDLDRLHAADEILIVGALRGAQSVQDLIAATISSGASSWM
jgi:para-aminobenzoate synthetase/4-amino-4-deoxychorismate lyase